MNMIYIPALAGFGGSAFGAVSTIIANWAANRRKDPSSLAQPSPSAKGSIRVSSKRHRPSMKIAILLVRDDIGANDVESAWTKTSFESQH